MYVPRSPMRRGRSSSGALLTDNDGRYNTGNIIDLLIILMLYIRIVIFINMTYVILFEIPTFHLLYVLMKRKPSYTFHHPEIVSTN